MSVVSQELQAVDKQVLALKLRQSGMEYAEIAKVCGYKSASGALAAVKSALKKTLQEPADELRKLELARLDAAQSAIWSAVQKGSLTAIDRFLRISKQRAEMLGLNAPVNVNLSGEVEHHHSVSIDEIDAIRAKRWQEVQSYLAQLPPANEGAAVELDIDISTDNENARNEAE